VVGEEFYAFYIIIYREMLGEGCEVGVVIRIVRHEHMPNPGGFLDLVEIVEEGLVVGARVSRVGLVEGVIEGLDVEQDKVGVFEHLAHFVVEEDSAGVERRMDVGFLAESQKLDEEVGLQKWFAS
jgi:hypothetical protein